MMRTNSNRTELGKAPITQQGCIDIIALMLEHKMTAGYIEIVDHDTWMDATWYKGQNLPNMAGRVCAIMTGPVAFASSPTLWWNVQAHEPTQLAVLINAALDQND